MIKITSYDRNRPYNELPLLPPPNSAFDTEVLTKWGRASRALAKLSSNLLRLPNPGMLINTISLQEAKSSSEIENIFTTEDDLYKAISDTVREAAANPATKEVLRYREALWGGYQSISKSGTLKMDTIVKVYQKIKDTRQGIRPAQSQIIIRRGDSKLRPGEVIYTPPRGEGIIEQKMQNLLSYLNDDKFNVTDPLIRMAVVHYQFEAIHPFTDGNGRTGRIINLLYLVNQGLISQPVLYLSKYIITHKDDYYFHLGGVTQRGLWKPWLLYMMDAVENTSHQTNLMIDDIIGQMQATLEQGKNKLKWYSKELNEALFAQPYIKPKKVGELLGRTSRTTITGYMSELVSVGILTPKQDGKEVFYINNDLIRILEG